MRSKPIVLIGGTAGTGKTSLANCLFCMYRFDQRLATGFLREAVRSVLPERDALTLGTHTFRPLANEDIIDHYTRQCEMLARPIKACINRVKVEGTSLILEGSNLLPTLADLSGVDLFVLLIVANETSLRARVEGETHLKRRVTDMDFHHILRIQAHLLMLASVAKSERLMVVNNSDFKETSRVVSDRVLLLFKGSPNG